MAKGGVYPVKRNGKQQTDDHGNKYWTYVYYRSDGTRVRKYHIGQKREAETLWLQKAKYHDEVRLGLRAPEDRLEELTFNQMWARFVEHLQKRKRRPKTIERYNTSFKMFDQLYNGDIITLNEIDVDFVHDYKEQRLEDVANDTVNTDLRNLRALLNYAEKHHYIKENPFPDVEFVKNTKTHNPGANQRFYTDNEIQSMRNAMLTDTAYADARDVYEAFMTYLLTGARATEILPERQFRWSNIEWHRSRMLFHGKRDKDRYVPVADELKHLLQQRRTRYPDTTYVFEGWTYDNVYIRIIKRYAQKYCEIHDVNIHDIRRTTGARLRLQGFDLYYIKEFLGHESVTTTEKHYMDIEPGEYTRGANALAQGILNGN